MTDLTTETLQARRLAPGQRCRVMVAFIDGRPPELVHETRETLLEAPNWTDDDSLLLNGDGVMWRLDLETAELTRVPFHSIPPVNNDHVLAPSGDTVFMSAMDGHIYAGPIAGGTVRRVTTDEVPGRWHFLHGVSPDGGQLAYVAFEGAFHGAHTANIHLLDLADGRDRPITIGDRHADGCEYSLDGGWILFNTEAFSERPGHAQLARVRTDGTGLEQLTFDERVNWFPHVGPDGRHLVYLSYPPGTEGHPPDLTVELRLVRDGAFNDPATVATLSGGQGTINVPSWSPDGTRFAYVEYPHAR